MRVFSDFSKVLSGGVKLFLSAPVSKNPGLIFNAARDLDPKEMINNARNNGFTIDEMALVLDSWELVINPTDDQLMEPEYGCLILCLTKN